MPRFLSTVFAVFACIVFSMCAKADESPSTQSKSYQMLIKVNDRILIADMVANSSTDALKDLLVDGDITINMHDYANFEKVGSLPRTLPSNNEHITTQAGDLILYQGNQFVIYYDTNSWNFTRLGKIKGVSQSELKSILGSGDVTVVLSLSESSGIGITQLDTTKSEEEYFNISGIKAGINSKGILISKTGKKIMK